MKRLYDITKGLLGEMVKEEHIELNKYLKPEECKTLKDIYEQALSSLCNRDRMSKYINFNRYRICNYINFERRNQLKELLFDFNPVKVKEKYGERWEPLIAAFNEKIGLKIEPQEKKSRLWVIFGKGVISSAIFLSEFKDKKDFDDFVKSFQKNKYYREALPMLLDKEIFGFGFALACDFLKEAGYVSYAKPDVHLMDIFKESRLCKKNDADYKVFKTIIELAEVVGKTPYEVDKRIWLVCTGNFYLDKEPTNKKKGKKKELLRLLSE